VVGQDRLIEGMLMAPLARGNVLLENPPGLAKNRAVRTLAHNRAADLPRVPFEPELVPPLRSLRTCPRD
jgi:MoxR-like ATPase